MSSDKTTQLCIIHINLFSIHSKIFYIYGFLLTFCLLWPFDFNFFNKNLVSWDRNGDGVIFDNGQILSTAPQITLYDKICLGTGLSIELWVSSQKENQSGPARVISYSADPFQRNFTLAQEKDALVVRLRTIYTDINGMYPHTKLSGVFSLQEVRHIVVTFNFYEVCIYIDGQLSLRQSAPLGGFDNWDPSYPLVFGNECTGDRSWAGQIFYAAIYNRPIDLDRIKRNYFKGWRGCRVNDQETEYKKDLVVCYYFNETEGDKVHDKCGNSNPVDLTIPGALNKPKRPYLSMTFGEASVLDISILSDILLNVMAFIPLGFLVQAFLRNRFGISINNATVVTLVMGAVFALGIESIQFFSPTRFSSLIDIGCNLVGIYFGVTVYRFFYNHLVEMNINYVRVKQ